MARPKHKKDPQPPKHHCGMCDEAFDTRTKLRQHTLNHPDLAVSRAKCPICSWPFQDSHALEQHFLQTGHGAPQFECENCGDVFISKRGLDEHTKSTSGCKKGQTVSSKITCDRCPDTFSNRREYEKHRSFPDGPCADHKKRTPPKTQRQPVPALPSFIDSDQPENWSHSPLEYNSSEATPNSLSEGDEYCYDCKGRFKSKASFNLHALGCAIQKRSNVPPMTGKSANNFSPVTSLKAQNLIKDYSPVGNGHSIAAESSPAAPPRAVPDKTQDLAVKQTSTSVLKHDQPMAQTSSSTFVCEVRNCGKTFKSNAGLKAHQADIHGIGGKALDIHGRQSFMINPRVRDKLRQEGLLREQSSFSHSHGNGERPSSAPSKHGNTYVPKLPSAPAVQPVPQHVTRRSTVMTSSPHYAPPQSAMQYAPNNMLDSVPSSGITTGSVEMEQAKCIQSQIMRLLVQSDIFIQHTGQMTVDGLGWVRIPVSKQDAATKIFDEMCHLPKTIQPLEYLPPPRTFKDEYMARYPIGEFKYSPEVDASNPGLSIIALSCSKVFLDNNCHEIVKIAAIDVMTCRILLDHLVCTNPDVNVANWCSTETGLRSWRDMEEARQAGYKVLKGWSAARSALWKFMDKDTIIVGYNLRSDLDALRMIHGRAVDIAKVVEKAAKGPLSKVQLSLASLCRTYLDKTLKNNPVYGQDCLVTAFAVRELGLWTIKNRDTLEKDARQRSLDYQKVAPKGKA